MYSDNSTIEYIFELLCIRTILIITEKKLDKYIKFVTIHRVKQSQ